MQVCLWTREYWASIYPLPSNGISCSNEVMDLDMPVNTKKPELRRDKISVAANCFALAVVAFLSGGLWMLVR